jgi:hypothetical protein
MTANQSWLVMRAPSIHSKGSPASECFPVEGIEYPAYRTTIDFFCVTVITAVLFNSSSASGDQVMTGNLPGEDVKPQPETDLCADKPSLRDGVAEDTVHAAEEYSDGYYRKLLWKIDLWLLPLMRMCYGTQQADKTSLNTQAVFGIWEDTGLVGEQYNWLSTIFYLSYMVCEAPGNWLLQKFHTGKFLGAVMVLWGIIVLCIAFAKNFAHLMVLRTFQDTLECTISPTFMLITGAWYKSQEHTFRSTIWGITNAGINIITGLIMYGIGAHAEAHPGSLAAVRVSWV